MAQMEDGSKQRHELPNSQTMNGTVYLVGAGPGDPKLLTRRGLELLQECDCIIYDALIGQELLNLAREDAELVFCRQAVGATLDDAGRNQRALS